jgi:predicted secreted protein
MRFLTACLLTCILAADADKTIKLTDFEGKKVQEVKVKVIKEEMTVKKGESFSVKLESNPSTGYSWRVLGPEYGPLELKKATFEKGDKPGAPGVQIFEFTAKKENQQVVLVFNYGRPFEGLGPQCYELKVKVSE